MGCLLLGGLRPLPKYAGANTHDRCTFFNRYFKSWLIPIERWRISTFSIASFVIRLAKSAIAGTTALNHRIIGKRTHRHQSLHPHPIERGNAFDEFERLVRQNAKFRRLVCGVDFDEDVDGAIDSVARFWSSSATRSLSTE